MATIRDFKAQVKAAGPEDGLREGQFLAIVSAFGNVDSYGERVVKGAFAEDVERWRDGEPLPIVWSHKWDDPFSHIGAHDEVEETDRGLQVLATTDTDNPTAVQVHRLLKARRIRQFSFAYDVLDSAPVEETVKAEGTGEEITRHVIELRKLRTYEAGPCLVGVNQETELIAAKAATLQQAVKGGRHLDRADMAQLLTAAESLREVITLHAPAKAYDERVPVEPSLTGTPPAADEPQTKTEGAAPVIARRAALVDLMFLK